MPVCNKQWHLSFPDLQQPLLRRLLQCATLADMGKRDLPSLAKRLHSIGVSQPYASQIVNGRRKPGLKLSLRIYKELGLKLGPIADAGDAEVAALARVFGSQNKRRSKPIGRESARA